MPALLPSQGFTEEAYRSLSTQDCKTLEARGCVIFIPGTASQLTFSEAVPLLRREVAHVLWANFSLTPFPFCISHRLRSPPCKIKPNKCPHNPLHSSSHFLSLAPDISLSYCIFPVVLGKKRATRSTCPIPQHSDICFPFSLLTETVLAAFIGSVFVDKPARP